MSASAFSAGRKARPDSLSRMRVSGATITVPYRSTVALCIWFTTHSRRMRL